MLDIGSHDGSLDLLLATRFTPRLLIGVEIDHRLATKAVKNMQDFINKEECMDLIQAELKKNKVANNSPGMAEKESDDADPFQSKLNDLVKRVKDLPKSL